MSEELNMFVYDKGINDRPRRDDGAIEIHTHDRINFKRCRWKWDFESGLRRHLVPKDNSNTNTWFGTGFHFAMEDYHGYRRFSTPMHAFQAYYDVFEKYYPEYMPPEHEELLELGLCMLDYYPVWLKQRDEYKTLWIDGEPQVEVEFSIEIPELSEYAGVTVVYQGAIDRVVEDAHGGLWLVDYKTVKRFDTDKLELDPQISAYCWAAEQYYERPVEGLIYHQFKKVAPRYPKVLARGGLSTDKRQYTTYSLFRIALEDLGYDLKNLPKNYQDYLNYLLEEETIEGDRFIRWDKVRRNHDFKQSEYDLIVIEGKEMLNPDLPLYPNPTYTCAYDCAFRTVCVARRDGSDADWLLDTMFEKKGETVNWRETIQWQDPEIRLGLQ